METSQTWTGTMFSPQYHNRAINDISRAIQEVITVLAITVNLMLLRIVFTSQRREIGSYRYLIATFAVSDLIYTSVHWLVYPIPEMYGNSYLLSGHNIISSRFGPCLYCTVYSQAVPILTFHFLYRTFAIRSPEYLSRPARFFGALFVTTVIVDLDGFFVMWVLFRPDEETLAKNAPFFAGNTSAPVIHRIETAGDHVQALYWSDDTFEKPRWLNLLGAFDMMAVISATYIIVIVCGHLINKYLKIQLRLGAHSESDDVRVSSTLRSSHSHFLTRFLQWIGLGKCMEHKDTSAEHHSGGYIRSRTSVSHLQPEFLQELLALTVNCMLLRIVFTSERRDIGSYRYLIATFAVSDLLYTSIHWLVYPIPEMYGNSYMISGHNILTSRIGPCIYGTIYSQAVPILTFHFLYRTFSIRNPEYLSRPFRFFGALLITTIIIDLDGFIVNWVLFRPDEETLAKNAPFFSGNVSTPVVHRIETARDHVQALFWSGKTFEKPRWLNLLGALNMFVVIGVTYIIVIVCSHLINEYLKEHAKSIRTVSLHRQLFRLLVCQAIYPLITTYFPLAVSVFSPIFGLNFDWVPVIKQDFCNGSGWDRAYRDRLKKSTVDERALPFRMVQMRLRHGILLIFALLCKTDAKVEFTYSTMYDVFDLPGGAEIPLPRCENGCLIFASIGGINDVDQYIKNMIVNDSVKGRIKSIADIATGFEPGTSQKVPLEITNSGKYSIKNLNAPADTAKDVTVWIVDRDAAKQVEYEIYDAAYMGRVPSSPKKVVTIMSASRFTVYVDKGEINPFSAWQVGFDNSLGNPDLCNYVIMIPDTIEFDGFKFPVDAPIFSFVFTTAKSVSLRADYNYLNTRSMTREGFITSPGYHGCVNVDPSQVHKSTSYHYSDQIELHGEPNFYVVNMDAITNLDEAHNIEVTNLADGSTLTIGGEWRNSQVNLPNAQTVTVYYHDVIAPQSFLIRYTTSIKDGSSSTSTSTQQPTTSAVGVATAVTAFAVVMSKLLALREVMQNH
ncbi:hypothetical protein PRIPAC_82459 [Pristionchus pacificus]|uniref:G protein-coupled receptor n=1 Tax=Pristionchus pacificus TaxID=54126 RepID=A0A2A6C3P7_PRIPA|nr:hypothetical protein PRIPAC_82459 [Pristionchus pacificus]|eukprot:PDM72718.1 G protein-coupled receptor [Pristionchus pacificus]